MIRNRLVSILLAPFSGLFGLGILLRNGLYRSGILRSARFNIPVIGVGNLTLGGAGKTPHVEYLIRLLSPYVKVGTLSRGYKRKSKGYRMVGRRDNALTVGDEPLQYYLKYPQVAVAVSESRSIGIPLMLSERPDIQVILLDDSYQHLSVTPFLNILLTEYEAPYSSDILLPAGRLREWKSGADRADIIIVSKCPNELASEERIQLGKRLGLKDHQSLYFSKYSYHQPYHLLRGTRHHLGDYPSIILLTAIANESYLLNHLLKSGSEIHTMTYEDHHIFSPHEVSLLKQQYDHLSLTSKTVILTTEKDATRLVLHRAYIEENQLPILVLPIYVSFLDDDGKRFDDQIQKALLEFKA